jgi:hypothetical protein
MDLPRMLGRLWRSCSEICRSVCALIQPHLGALLIQPHLGQPLLQLLRFPLWQLPLPLLRVGLLPF